MVLYECKRCGWSTKIKTHYKNHLHRKKICKPSVSNINIQTLKDEFYKNCQEFKDVEIETFKEIKNGLFYQANGKLSNY